jgi:hypothetical protein
LGYHVADEIDALATEEDELLALSAATHISGRAESRSRPRRSQWLSIILLAESSTRPRMRTILCELRL